MNLNTHEISVFRIVVFHETIFPFKKYSSDLPVDDVFSKTILPLFISITVDSVISPDPVPVASPTFVSPSPSASPSSSSVVPGLLEIVTTGTRQVALPIARPKRQGKAPN